MEDEDLNNSVNDNTESDFETVDDINEHEHAEGEKEAKMKKFMHSDTIIVILSLLFMIVLGLVFRSLMNKLTRMKQRKAKMRGGLKQMAESMHHVTR